MSVETAITQLSVVRMFMFIPTKSLCLFELFVTITVIGNENFKHP